MSGKQFFIDRYAKLGWKYEEVKLKRAIRTNSINNHGTSITKRLLHRGVQLTKIPFLNNGYWICKSKFSVGATSEYLSGLYSIQEAAAQIPATLFTNLEDKLLLDACAAPGGKTVQLADLMHNTGAIIALDVDKQRLTALSNQLERCHVKNTIVYRTDAREVSRLKIKFDRILLDVPCSGNFATDKEWFNRRTLEDVKKNATLQREMLSEANRVLKDDGEIVYSTCSLEPEEDELNIDWAIKKLELQVEEIDCYGEKASVNIFGKRLDSSIEKCKRIWPGQTQGFFVCKLKKKVSA
ncbi:MAG TPA: RsmB/NOP family class I SAM-dependent RNA methyltransferase [Candidatus Bathyarchaeia archaeon]|nr:RsmB/NOP family class I SAM-dependent RNA methyltransferase [Candidatus Bathyarchaeia archaeon]